MNTRNFTCVLASKYFNVFIFDLFFSSESSPIETKAFSIMSGAWIVELNEWLYELWLGDSSTSIA